MIWCGSAAGAAGWWMRGRETIAAVPWALNSTSTDCSEETIEFYGGGGDGDGHPPPPSCLSLMSVQTAPDHCVDESPSQPVEAHVQRFCCHFSFLWVVQ